MTIHEFVENLFYNICSDYDKKMDIETAKADLETFRTESWNMPESMTTEEYMNTWNEFVDKYQLESIMKTINYKGRDIEISAIRFTYGTESTVQEGILVHDTTDEFCNGDAIYGNGWTIGMVEDESDLETLFTSGDGSTYIHRNENGTYNVEV